MREVQLPPNAPAMLDSLRAIGYSFAAAIADILDNSVAAEASSIDIQFRSAPDPYVAIADDGFGMTEPELLTAMRHGGVGPNQARAASDLGRFGLGLKTASLSQCRQLTVVSKKNGDLAGARWDLDRVAATGEWTVGLLDRDEIEALPHLNDLAGKRTGTIVLWRAFDLATAGESDKAAALGKHVDLAREHLSLVFHRYISGVEGGRRLQISINNSPLVGLDPYLSKHPGTQALPAESFRVGDAEITLRPYVLPHFSRMSPADLTLAGGEDGLRRNQGFYVYRNRRLITYGTWFRLLRQEELTKLARVQVDIPNSLDHLWALDVRKSQAHPPEAVRSVLIRVVERIAGTSRHVYRFRARRPQDGITRVWERNIVRDGVEYSLNRGHPLVSSLFEVLDDAGDALLEHLMRSIEVALPIDGIYADVASERHVQSPPQDAELDALLYDSAKRMTDSLAHDPAAVQRLLESLMNVEPYSSHPTAARRVIEGIRSGN